jgi:hypothetical protein
LSLIHKTTVIVNNWTVDIPRSFRSWARADHGKGSENSSKQFKVLKNGSNFFNDFHFHTCQNHVGEFNWIQLPLKNFPCTRLSYGTQSADVNRLHKNLTQFETYVCYWVDSLSVIVATQLLGKSVDLWTEEVWICLPIKV